MGRISAGHLGRDESPSLFDGDGGVAPAPAVALARGVAACFEAVRAGRARSKSRIAVAAGLDLAGTDRAVAALRDAGLIERAAGSTDWHPTERGRDAVVETAPDPKRRRGGKAFGRVVEGSSGARLLALLDRPMRGAEIIERLGVTRQRVHQLVIRLVALGRLRIGDPDRHLLIVARADDSSLLLGADEECVLSALPDGEAATADHIAHAAGLPEARVAGILRGLREAGLVSNAAFGPRKNLWGLTAAGAGHCHRRVDGAKAPPVPLPVKSGRIESVLALLAEKGPSRARDIAAALGVHGQSMNALMQYLKRRKLAVKVGPALMDPHALTDFGQETLRAMRRRGPRSNGKGLPTARGAAARGAVGPTRPRGTAVTPSAPPKGPPMTWQPAPDRYETMTYNRCGASGLKLPAVSLGLWHNFGGTGAPETGRAMIRRAFDLGVTHFDLANNYGPPPGSAEENFGRVLADDLAAHRDELIVSTKAGYRMWPGPYGEWGSRKYLLASLDQSLKRMRLDHVDIFYSHRFDPDTPLDETMAALDQAVRSGKALYAGISSYSAEKTAEAAAALRSLGTPCLIHQPSYSMINRWVEGGLMDTLGREKIGCIAFSPLAQGMLTDKYLAGIPQDSRVARGGSLRREFLREDTIGRIRALDAIAQRRGQNLAQMALAWVLKDARVTSVLIGASSPAQIEDSVKALASPPFAAEELAEIDRYAIDAGVDLWARSRGA